MELNLNWNTGDVFLARGWNLICVLKDHPCCFVENEFWGQVRMEIGGSGGPG
jgi:hypothetical protein